MPSTATALAKPARLTRQEALYIINAMPCLVAASRALLEANSTVLIAFEIWDGERSFVFPSQPFTILRQITYHQYKQALPPRMHPATSRFSRYYEIFTD